MESRGGFKRRQRWDHTEPILYPRITNAGHWLSESLYVRTFPFQESCTKQVTPFDLCKGGRKNFYHLTLTHRGASGGGAINATSCIMALRKSGPALHHCQIISTLPILWSFQHGVGCPVRLEQAASQEADHTTSLQQDRFTYGKTNAWEVWQALNGLAELQEKTSLTRGYSQSSFTPEYEYIVPS